ncbi:hypothetical protein IC607_08575 [Cellulomonas sp. JH27-2]|uniref:hypothetical protein n=1 Tax=Cellulomonas sp. JH27-2 TaxID=2774139 RepID=UPI00177C3AE6|nr:hypothetical protein [Cellulomonas sp. JH27-2]MBD8059021.1 hypothetical protein [Cellulomonas sp. JH27-2]
MTVTTYPRMTAGMDPTIRLAGVTWRGPGVPAAVAHLTAARPTGWDLEHALQVLAARTALDACALLISGRTAHGYRQAQLAVALEAEAPLHRERP